jgi:hypothetical protein
MPTRHQYKSGVSLQKYGMIIPRHVWNRVQSAVADNSRRRACNVSSTWETRATNCRAGTDSRKHQGQNHAESEISAAEMKADYDTLIPSSKAYDLDASIDAILPVMGPATNGISQIDQLDAAFGQARV